jgi:hypothetical protein
MKNGEIACVVGRVISLEPLALALYDLRGHFQKCDPPVQRSTIEFIP